MTEEHIHDPEVDLDPQEALEQDYDPSTDVDHDPDPKHEDEFHFVPHPVEGALPVDDECEDLDLCPAEAEVPDDEEVDQ